MRRPGTAPWPMCAVRPHPFSTPLTHEEGERNAPEGPTDELAEFEKALVARQLNERMAEHTQAELPDSDVLDLLVTVFRDLRLGKLEDGTIVSSPKAVMSTAEMVNLAHAATLDATYLDGGTVAGGHIARQLQGVVFKDEPEDARKLRSYIDLVARDRARKSMVWKDFFNAAQKALARTETGE